MKKTILITISVIVTIIITGIVMIECANHRIQEIEFNILINEITDSIGYDLISITPRSMSVYTIELSNDSVYYVHRHWHEGCQHVTYDPNSLYNSILGHGTDM